MAQQRFRQPDGNGGELQHVYFQKPLKVTKHWEGRREIKMAWDDMMYHVNRTNAEETGNTIDLPKSYREEVSDRRRN